jgi:hypothetical protein
MRRTRPTVIPDDTQRGECLSAAQMTDIGLVKGYIVADTKLGEPRRVAKSGCEGTWRP